LSNKTKAYDEAVEQFVMLWGDMASAWGINKTMSQIHALLYAESDPLDTDTIMDRLDISRGNANMNLHRLLEWDLIEKVHLQGKRKDFYIAEKDVWKIVSQIIKERQQREIAPIRENLEKTIETLESEEMNETSEAFKERIENYIEFLEMFERFTNALLPYINKNNLSYLKQLVKLVEFKDSVKEFTKKSSREDIEDE
jgi:DNA-binding transcriptional regulator GbsR (MarR family)